MAGNQSKKSNIPQMQETRYIYLPGEPVKNIAVGSDYKIILGSVREIVFNFNLKNAKNITVEIQSSSNLIRYKGVYDLSTKKLVSGKFVISSGKPYRVHVSRFFTATFIVKADGKIIGRYTPRLLDPTNYGREAALWIEPLYIGFSEAEAKTPIVQMVQQHNNVSQRWLEQLPQFKYTSVLKPPYLPQTVSRNFSGVCEAPVSEHAAVFIYKPKNPNSRISEQSMTVGQLKPLLNEQDFNELVGAIAAYGEPDNAAVMGAVSYTIDNRHWAKALNRRIQVKWVRGYLAIVFKGQQPPFNFTYAGLAHEKLKGMSGGKHIRQGKRVQLQMNAQGIKQGVKQVSKDIVNMGKQIKGLAAVGLIIDFVGDYKAVMVDEKGSRDVWELMGRAGISVVMAFVGIAAASLALSALIYALALAGVATSAGVVLGVGILIVMAVGAGISYASSLLKEKIYGG